MYTTPPLHKVIGNNRYCGPAAISAITGMTTDEAAAAARAIFGQGKIIGMWPNEIERVLHTRGYHTVKCCEFKEDHNPTISQWRRFMDNPKGTYLIGCLINEPPEAHVVVMRGTLIVDNYLGKPTALSRTRHRLALVEDVTRIELVRVERISDRAHPND